MNMNEPGKHVQSSKTDREGEVYDFTFMNYLE